MVLPRKLLILCAGVPATSGSAFSSPQAPTSSCSDVVFDITVSPENAVFSPSPEPQNDTALREFLDNSFRGDLPRITGRTTVNGAFAISGTYCVPRNPGKPVDTLQILIHGITYSKSFWSGFDSFQDRYNWHKHANARGYATLAIDRLGSGNSSRPDPIHAVQPPLEIALINQIVLASQGLPSSISPDTNPFSTQMHRSEQLSSSQRSPTKPELLLKQKYYYPKTILVGHSYGSYLAPALTNFFPSTEISALVLTAFSTNFSLAFLATQQWGPASEAFPKNAYFRNLPKGYFTQINSTQREESFYAGGYDKRVPQIDFANGLDTLAVGSFGAFAAMSSPAGNFTGPVLAVTGELDRAVCQRPREKCAEIMRESGEFFPSLRGGGEFKLTGQSRHGRDSETRENNNNWIYQYYIPVNTGHDLTLHYSAQETMGQVHNWLDYWV